MHSVTFVRVVSRDSLVLDKLDLCLLLFLLVEFDAGTDGSTQFQHHIDIRCTHVGPMRTLILP